MQTSNQGDDRWKELAELLGLPSEQDSRPTGCEPKPVASAPAPITHPIEPVESEPLRYEPVADEEMYEEVEEIIEEEEDTVVDEQLPVHVAEKEMRDDDMEDEESADAASGLEDEESAETPTAPGEEEKPKRGRRRRRRGRRRGGDKAEGEGGQPTAARAPEPRDSRQGQPRQREERSARPAQPASASRDRDAAPNGRGDSRSRRGRHDETPQPRRPEMEVTDEMSEELEEVEMSNAPASLARTLDDDTDFSDWTVPSWQDLISALYRPDR